MQTATGSVRSNDAQHRPGADTLARLRGLDAEALWVVYHDYAGLGRAKAVPPARFEEVAAEGVTFAMANWDLAITDEQSRIPSSARTPATSVPCRTRRPSSRSRTGPAWRKRSPS
jgi:hypothetical protein